MPFGPDLSTWKIDEEVQLSAERYFASTLSEYARISPYLMDRATWWIRRIYGDPPIRAFLADDAHPMLLLPWWFDRSLGGEVDRSFHVAMIVSTLLGYMHIRVTDEIMDRGSRSAIDILPVLGLWHSAFESAYRKYFRPDHRFWRFFGETLARSAEATVWSRDLKTVSRSDFLRVAAQRTCAGKIPLAAVVFHRGFANSSRLDRWLAFYDVFACWHQMADDMRDWAEDLENGTATYFLTEATRRRPRRMSMSEWALMEGLEWGLGLLDTWMKQMRQMASRMGSPELETYLAMRESRLYEQGLSPAAS